LAVFKSKIINIEIMYKKILSFVFCLSALNVLYGQAEAQYTQYMYNTSIINPAYSGSEEVLKIALLHRSQWVGIPGGPETQTFSLESMIAQKIGVSLNVSKDEIGPSNEVVFDLNLSYYIQVTDNGRLAFGMKGGGRKLSMNLNKGSLFDTQTPQTVNSLNNNFFPTLGAGLYYYTNKSYIGFSVPNLLITNRYVGDGNESYTNDTHYHFIMGSVFKLNNYVKFKPAILLKAVAGSPISIDVSSNFMFYDKLILGVAYRFDAAISGLVGFNVSKNFFVGYASDYSTGFENNAFGSSHEVFLSLRFPMGSIYESPRFF
jgi:type IX secretion system PorP/SprF family membrane protein